MNQFKSDCDNPALVSIIMPAYNSVDLIRESICSVLEQTYRNFELIVINDGSTDHTADVVTSFNDSRIILLQQDNSGVAAARNTGIARARGCFIAFLDSDDIWLADKLEKQVHFLFLHPEIGFVYSAFYCFNTSSKDYLFSAYLEPHEVDNDYLRLLTHDFIPTLTVIVRRKCLDAYDNHKVFDTDLFGTEDWDLWIRISKMTSMHKIDEPLALYRIHSNGISKNFPRQHNQEYLVLQKNVLSDASVPLNIKKTALFIWERKYLGYLIKDASYYKAIKQIILLLAKFGFFYSLTKLAIKLKHGIKR